MESMVIQVISARRVGDKVRAVIRAESQPEALIHLLLEFEPLDSTNMWEEARNQALRYLDVA